MSLVMSHHLLISMEGEISGKTLTGYEKNFIIY